MYSSPATGSDQLTVGLIAQLVEHCTSIAGHGLESRSTLDFDRASAKKKIPLIKLFGPKIVFSS